LHYFSVFAVFRYDYDEIFPSKKGRFYKALCKRIKRHFETFFSKNALKPKENGKKQDYFSQKVIFRA